MRKGVVLLWGLVLVLLISVWPAQTRPGSDNILEFKSMVAVKPPFTGATNPVRGVAGAGAPWQISSAKGELKTDGTLEIEVVGLTLVSTGLNPLANFRGAVNCQSVDGTGAPSIVTLSTGDFPATTGGHAKIEATVELPSPCIAPIVFVTTSTGRWLATTGR